MSAKKKDDEEDNELEDILEEEDGNEEAEPVEEEIENQQPPETIVEMGLDEFQERLGAFWASLGEPITKAAGDPKPEPKPAPKPQPKPQPKKKEGNDGKTQKGKTVKKFRVRLFRKF